MHVSCVGMAEIKPMPSSLANYNLANYTKGVVPRFHLSLNTTPSCRPAVDPTSSQAAAHPASCGFPSQLRLSQPAAAAPASCGCSSQPHSSAPTTRLGGAAETASRAVVQALA